MSPHEGTTKPLSLDSIHELVVRDAAVVVSDGADAGRKVSCAGGTVVVGSGTGCDLRLADPRVSRRHLEVRGEPRGVRVVDRGSRNGTFFHGARITELLLTESAQLMVANTRLVIEVGREPVKIPFSQRTHFGSAVADSEAMRHVFRVLELAADKDITVLLEGESGTGKEVLAAGLHAESPRRDGPFVVVDCGAIAPNLVESELFGHERGAFTGAAATHVGAFERAHGGTLFLDEIGELPLDAQPKLLRALESRTVRRVGGKTTIPFDARIVGATNRNLKEGVRLNEFRSDLFYRLAVVHVVVPPLRDRKEDIPLLATRFLRVAARDPTAKLPDGLGRLLTSYDWPGNVRELRNVIDRFSMFQNADPTLLFDGRVGETPRVPGIDFEALARLPYADGKRLAIDAYHRAVVPRVLEQHGGSVPKAAEALGTSRANLYRVLQELGRSADEDDA